MVIVGLFSLRKKAPNKKVRDLIVRKKCERGPFVRNGFVFHARGFGCIQNQVLTTNGKKGKSAQCTKSGPIVLKRIEVTMELVNVTTSLRQRRLKKRVSSMAIIKFLGFEVLCSQKSQKNAL